MNWHNVKFKPVLPSPEECAVHSCSEDPDFYKEKIDCFKIRYNLFHKKNPFGSLLGYRTTLGTVPVPTEPIGGYVFCTETRKWVLYATPPAANRGLIGGVRGFPHFRKKGWRWREKGEDWEKIVTLLPFVVVSPRGLSLPLVSILDQLYITNLASSLVTPIYVYVRGAALIRTHAYRRYTNGVIEAKPVSKTAQTRSSRDRHKYLFRNRPDATTTPSVQDIDQITTNQLPIFIQTYPRKPM